MKRLFLLLWVTVWHRCSIVMAYNLIPHGITAWVAARLCRSGLFSDHALVTGAACWTAAVFALYGVLVWMVDGALIPRYFLLLVAILAVPLARLSATPLALAWNRHR